MADLDQPKETQESHEELVKVFDTEQESEAMVVRGLLEANGIEAMIENLDAPQDVLPGVGGVVVLVRAERAQEAARLIQESRVDIPDDETVSEEQV
jgi:Putative prokaryotic signal transducing protein